MTGGHAHIFQIRLDYFLVFSQVLRRGGTANLGQKAAGQHYGFLHAILTEDHALQVALQVPRALVPNLGEECLHLLDAFVVRGERVQVVVQHALALNYLAAGLLHGTHRSVELGALLWLRLTRSFSQLGYSRVQVVLLGVQVHLRALVLAGHLRECGDDVAEPRGDGGQVRFVPVGADALATSMCALFLLLVLSVRVLLVGARVLIDGGKLSCPLLGGLQPLGVPIHVIALEVVDKLRPDVTVRGLATVHGLGVFTVAGQKRLCCRICTRLQVVEISEVRFEQVQRVLPVAKRKLLELLLLFIVRSLGLLAAAEDVLGASTKIVRRLAFVR